MGTLEAGIRYTAEFFMGKANVHETLNNLVARLEELEISYALVGAMALNEYGHIRATVDVGLLLTREGLETFKRHWLGRGYVEKFAGSKGVRDVSNDVKVDFIIAGEYPGDGKPKPIKFPDPAREAIRSERYMVLPLERFIELKLASGISAAHRIQDFADVLNLIRARDLPAGFETHLHDYVRPKYRELWQAAQHRDPE